MQLSLSSRLLYGSDATVWVLLGALMVGALGLGLSLFFGARRLLRSEGLLTDALGVVLLGVLVTGVIYLIAAGYLSAHMGAD